MIKTISAWQDRRPLNPQLSRCGFTTLLLFVAVFSALTRSAIAQQDENTEPARPTGVPASFKVSGTVTSVRVVEEERTVKVHLGVNLVAANTGQEDLILLRRSPATNAEYLFATATGNDPLWMIAHPAAATHTERKGENLKSELDQKEPPEDTTIILNPGDTIGWDIPVELTFQKAVEPRQVQVGTPPRPAWDAVRKSCPCFLKVDLDLWPTVIESKPDPENPAFARKLAARWKKKGRLLFTEKRSEAIPLNLQNTR
jgi:hypothetical protein